MVLVVTSYFQPEIEGIEGNRSRVRSGVGGLSCRRSDRSARQPSMIGDCAFFFIFFPIFCSDGADSPFLNVARAHRRKSELIFRCIDYRFIPILSQLLMGDIGLLIPHWPLTHPLKDNHFFQVFIIEGWFWSLIWEDCGFPISAMTSFLLEIEGNWFPKEKHFPN